MTVTQPRSFVTPKTHLKVALGRLVVLLNLAVDQMTHNQIVKLSMVASGQPMAPQVTMQHVDLISF
jgi:hypothetical protein